MRKAMAEAEVGDDVIGSDPTVEELQAEVAGILGKEAAIFMPSGTMTNQIAVRTHCKPGDEFLCEEGCHIYNYEQGAFAQLSGLVARPIRGQRGVLKVEDLDGTVRPINEHMVRTRLLCLENTHNRAAGRVLPMNDIASVTGWAREQGLSLHLDGARLFNAVVATGVSASEWSRHFDSVSICFSKGLGAPVGSALAGPREFVQEARWHRKAFGGGMRQVGIIAAGALYALRHNVARLKEDHEKAQFLAQAVREAPRVELIHDEVDSNIVIFAVKGRMHAAAEFSRCLEQQGIRSLTTSPQHIRMVTHLDVSWDQTHRAANALKEVAEIL
jgi:threonine aldolase